MAPEPKDPTEPMRLMASRFPEVAEGTACTQSSFKVGKSSFFFVGMQGGRYKLMFKLKQSLPEAARLAKQSPDDYGVGSTGWVSARFTAEKPIPKKIWAAWLKESYELSTAPKKATKKKAVAKKTTKKKTTKKMTAKKMPGQEDARLSTLACHAGCFAAGSAGERSITPELWTLAAGFP